MSWIRTVCGVFVGVGVLVGVFVTSGVGVGVKVPTPQTLPFELLRGLGAPLEKSLALLSVSIQPSAARRAAVVFDKVAAGFVSEQLAVLPVVLPYPMKSTTLVANGQPVPVNA